jgi:hypothetical protein
MVQARATISTDAEALSKLADQIATLALEQCRVYAQGVPAAMVHGKIAGEVNIRDKQRTLEYAVLKAIEGRVNSF